MLIPWGKPTKLKLLKGGRKLFSICFVTICNVCVRTLTPNRCCTMWLTGKHGALWDLESSVMGLAMTWVTEGWEWWGLSYTLAMPALRSLEKIHMTMSNTCAWLWFSLSDDTILLLHICLPLEHISPGGLLDHEENLPALKGSFYSTTGHIFPPLPDNGNLIRSLCEPGSIFNAVQHIVRSQNPLS